MPERKARLSRAEFVRKMIELPAEDAAWFEEHYPGGSFSWVLAGLLHEFRLAHKQTPHDYMVIGALEIKKLTEEKS